MTHLFGGSGQRVALATTVASLVLGIGVASANEPTTTVTVTKLPVVCPRVAAFDALRYANIGQGFMIRTTKGQTIVGAKRFGKKIPSMLTTSRGRSQLPRIEYITARSIDARRLPSFARKIGPRRVVVALVGDVTSNRTTKLRLPNPAKSQSAPQLILPLGSVKTTRSDCPIASTVTIPARVGIVQAAK